MADNRSLIAVAAGASVVAAMAVATPTGRSSAPVAAQDTVIVFTGERPKAPTSFDRGRDLLWREIAGGGSDSSGARRDAKVAHAFLDSAGLHLTILVATVADPVDSHLDWLYDLQLAAIRLAHATAGYVPSGYWLSPWSKGEQSTDARKSQPGAMLFRTARGDRLSLVYLVGELPTTGIHKEAFRAAVAERNTILHLTCRQPGKAPHDLLVIGPTFAGGALSLRQTLDNIDTMPAKVVTGTATADIVASILRRPKRGPVASIEYSATVHTDRTYSRVRDALIKQTWSDSAPLAILSEASTTYGMVPTGQEPLHIPFPLNIATLRVAYERNETDTTHRGAARQPLQWRDPPRAEETPAPVSALTIPSIDRAFEDVARLLRSRHTRIVELNATDIRDKLFLADQVRQRVPDAQLLTREMHVLYADPSVEPTVRGLFILSTYPPGLRNQSRLDLDSLDATRRIPFLSDDMEGVYNATLLQLGYPERLADYRWPFDKDTTAGSRLPPIWISVVGSGGIVAVHAERAVSTDTAGMVKAMTPLPKPDHRPLRAQAWFLAAPFAIAALVLLLWLSYSLLAVATQDDSSQLIVSLGLVTALAPAAAAAARSRFEIATIPDRIPLTILEAGCIAALIAYPLAVVRHVQIVGVKRPKVSRVVILLFAHAMAVIAVIAAVILERLPGAGDVHGGGVLIDRVTLLARGVSPIVPAVLIGLGVCVWGWWDAQRLRYFTHGIARIRLAWNLRALAGQITGNLGDAARHTKRLTDRMENPAVGKSTMTFVILLAILAGASVADLRMPLEDIGVMWPAAGASAFKWLVRCGVAASVAVPLWMTVQTWLLWWDLRSTLNALSRTPLYSAFERLPTFASRITQLAVFSFGWLARLRTLGEVAGLQGQELLTQDPTTPLLFTSVWQQLQGFWDVEPTQGVQIAARDAVKSLPARGAGGTFALQPSVLSMNRRTFPTLDRLWMRGAEEWLAVQIVLYVEWVFQYIIRITRFVLLIVVLTTLLLSSYQFYPQDFFVKTFFAIAGVCALALIVLMASIDRDETVSAITNTTPGKLSWSTSFVANLLVIGGVPLITLLSASFPAIRGVLFAWVQPLLTAISKGS